MNILIVTAMFPPIHTGTSFYAKNLAHALTARGNQVRVVTVSNTESDAGGYDYPVIRIPALHFPLKNFFKHFRIASFFPKNYLRMFALVENDRPDVILLVNHYLDIAFPAIVTARKYGIPLVCSVGTQLQSNNPRRNRILNFLDRLICGNLVFPFCDKIISWDSQIHQYLADVHDAKVTDKSVIVPYGVNGDVQRFMEHRHDSRIHHQLLGVGSVIAQRDFVFLVKIFAILVKQFPLLRLKIIGHVYYDEAVKLAQRLGLANFVDFTGELPHAQVLEEFKKSDMYFCITSGKYSGLGTATIESMLMGIPAVSNAPGNLFGPQLLNDQINYIFCDGQDELEAAQKIARLLGNPGLLHSIGQGGRLFVSTYLDWNQVAGQMEDLFGSLGNSGLVPTVKA